MKRIAFALLLAAFAFAPGAQAQQADSSADQLTALVVEALPIGEMFQTFIDTQPQWPLNEKASRVPASQLQCLRDRLSTRGYREQRAAEAEAFMRRYPEKVEGSLRVLREGGAVMSGSSVRAGLEQAKTGQKADFNAVASRFSPGQLSAFIELTSDDKHRALRELIGIDDSVSVQQSGEENRTRGRNKGMMIGMKLMLSAMDYCKVPLAAVQ